MHASLQQREARVGPPGPNAHSADRGHALDGRGRALQLLQQAADDSPRVAGLDAQATALQRRPTASGQTVVQRKGEGGLGSTLWNWGARAVTAARDNPWVSVPLGLLAIGGGLAYAYSRSGVRRRPDQLDANDLPEDQLWRTYINPKDFHQAELLDDPGQIYDHDKSPGFQASLLRAVREELSFRGGHLGRRVDWDEYSRLHDLVSAGLTKRGIGERETRDTARAPSSGHDIWWDGERYTAEDPGRDFDKSQHIGFSRVAFPVNDWNDDDLDLADDLLAESIEGRPLVGRGGVALDESVATYEGGQLWLNYSLGQGQVITQQLLDRYYREVDAADTREGKLRAIVKAIRAIHVTHAFRDANGRLNVNILLNKFLLEQGFDPTILPEQGLGIFGGAFSIEQLAEAVSAGSARFRELAGR
jgi:hypothetical protein